MRNKAKEAGDLAQLHCTVVLTEWGIIRENFAANCTAAEFFEVIASIGTQLSAVPANASDFYQVSIFSK